MLHKTNFDKFRLVLLWMVTGACTLFAQTNPETLLFNKSDSLNHLSHYNQEELPSQQTPFTTKKIIPHALYIDENGTATIDDILVQQKVLVWKKGAKTPHEANKIYWMRASLYGSHEFRGEQILHIAPSAGMDAFSFDYVDSYFVDSQGNYQHQRTGDKVALKERPLEHWINFIKLDIGETDTLDLYVRLEGADAKYLGHHLGLSLFQVDLFSLFPNQSNQALNAGLYFGILALQCVFFFLLYIIEKDRIHLYYSIFVLGLFLIHCFEEPIYQSYVLFPAIRDYHVALFFLGYFLLSLGALKFVQYFFSYSKDSVYVKWIIPIFIFCCAIVYANSAIQFEFWDKNLASYTSKSYFLLAITFLVLAIIIGMSAAIKAPKERNGFKLFFFIAFTPNIIVAVVHLGYAIIFETIVGDEFSQLLWVWQKLSTVVMLTLLALSIGYRTNRLKLNQALALQKNLADQKSINKAISRFVPNEFLDALGKSNITEIKLGDTAQKEVTVFFSDIRNYTTLSEKMTPEDNFRFVNAYNGRMGPIIQQYKGFVNQYLGDGIMAIFPNSPNEALWAAIDMQKAIQLYNKQRVAQGKDIIKVGMGMHSGPLIMGITGDENRLDAATISDSVNSASRIENLTKHYGASILLSDASLKKITNHASFHFRYLGEVQVKGKLEALKIYECFDGDLPEQKALKIETLPTFEQGIHAYFNKAFAKATFKFKTVLAQNPNDQTAKIFLNKARTLDEVGVTGDWTGVELMLEK